MLRHILLRLIHRNANAQPLSGRGPPVYIRKKHSILLCFLVAGRRIELRTS